MTANDPRTLRFTTRLEARGPAAAIILDDAQLAQIGGGKKTLPVLVTVNGHTFPGRIARMRGETMIGLRKEIRAACRVEAGDEIEVAIAPDEAPRTVEVPDALTAALDGAPAARRAFDALSYTHRKEYARWVSDAKTEATPERRVAETVRRLEEGARSAARGS